MTCSCGRPLPRVFFYRLCDDCLTVASDLVTGRKGADDYGQPAPLNVEDRGAGGSVGQTTPVSSEVKR